MGLPDSLSVGHFSQVQHSCVVRKRAFQDESHFVEKAARCCPSSALSLSLLANAWRQIKVKSKAGQSLADRKEKRAKYQSVGKEAGRGAKWLLLASASKSQNRLQRRSPASSFPLHFGMQSSAPGTLSAVSSHPSWPVVHRTLMDTSKEANT